MKICAIAKTTLIDYPGHVAATVFLAGCNFRCPWCYSKELVLPELIAQQPEILPEEFFAFLEGKRGLLEGVVLCGGEPTLNPDLPEFIKKIKAMGFLVKLDSNGSNPKMLKELIDNELIDYVAMDIKLSKEKYALVFSGGPTPANKAGLNAGVQPPQQFPQNLQVEDIEESIKILKNGAVDFEFRTTVAPGVHTPDDLGRMAKWIGQEVPGMPPKYFLQNFRPERNIDPKFETKKPFPPEFFIEALEKIKPFVSDCHLR
jgi:pyruvate formate lyase activating enzyme